MENNDMPQRKKLADLARENKTIIIIIAVGLFLIELEIFAVAALKSGTDYKLQVMDNNGNLIHETDGKNLSDFNKYYFEKTFGSFDDYQVKLVKNDRPFPFRAWFVAAVGIPIGVILLFAFVVKAYMALFHNEDELSFAKNAENGQYHTRMERIIAGVSRFNIFVIGFLVLFSVLLYWIIPNFATYVGRVGIDTLIRFKWFFLTASLMIFALIIWIIYLKYRLAGKAIDSQVEVDKYKMKLEYTHGVKMGPSLEYHKTGDEDIPLVAWKEEDDNTTPPSSRPGASNGKDN